MALRNKAVPRNHNHTHWFIPGHVPGARLAASAMPLRRARATRQDGGAQPRLAKRSNARVGNTRFRNAAA